MCGVLVVFFKFEEGFSLGVMMVLLGIFLNLRRCFSFIFVVFCIWDDFILLVWIMMGLDFFECLILNKILFNFFVIIYGLV